MEKRKRIFRLITWFLLGFTALFIFRLIYGYTDSNMKGYEENEYISDYLDNMDAIKRNYASDSWTRSSKEGGFQKQETSYGKGEPAASAQTKLVGEQKFEKIASVKSKSDKFDQDEKTTRAAVKKHDALIQYEHTEGNPGSRELHLSIGVPPEKFDSFLKDVKAIGTLKSIQVTKTDKTNEYRGLNAQKASLEKIRNNLMDLKSKEGKIQEFIDLSNRILEIENEFCTVQFTVKEGRFIPISLMHRFKVALEWTINYYCIFTLILLFITGISFFVVFIIDIIKKNGKPGVK
jgi:hypothetical protein